MAGAGFHMELHDDGLNSAIDRLLDFGEHPEDILDAMASMVESQTRRRLQEEKTSPDGDPWQEWDPRYAKTRHSGHSLLQNEGHLLDSISYEVRGNEAEIGSNLVYAGVQNRDRTYLGLSPDNESELESLLTEWISELI
jgi:phage gpG-like protein